MAKKKNKNNSQQQQQQHHHEEEIINNGGDTEVEQKESGEGTGDNNNNNNNKDGKNNSNNGAIVLKIEMHCEGCASRVLKLARSFQGVESVKVDSESNKLTVMGKGKLNPSQIRDFLHQKTKKKVEILSPQPKKMILPAPYLVKSKQEQWKEEAGRGRRKQEQS